MVRTTRRKTPELVRRQRALAFVVDKYKGRPCNFKAADCVRMARTMLVKMGHRGLPKLPRYSTLAGAKRAMLAAGYASVSEMFDDLLQRIPPATMRMGDLAVVPGAHGFDATFIKEGSKYLGWSEQNDFAEPVYMVLNGDDFLAAWSVL